MKTALQIILNAIDDGVTLIAAGRTIQMFNPARCGYYRLPAGGFWDCSGRTSLSW